MPTEIPDSTQKVLHYVEANVQGYFDTFRHALRLRERDQEI